MIPFLLTARSLRALADGCVAVLLPAYLLALGFGTLEVGVLSTVTMTGSAAATLAVGRWGNRFDLRRLLVAAAALMALTGIGFAAFSTLWPLLIVALVGTMNPGGGDVSVFYPLEHTALAAAAPAEARTTAFARYSFIGSLLGAVGALAAGVPDWAAGRYGVATRDVLKLMSVAYGAVGVAVGALYSQLPPAGAVERSAVPLGPSRTVVWKLAGLFSVDSFAGGLIVNALLALWLFERFDLSLSAASVFFFWSGVLSAFSFPVAAWIGARIGLVNTMVFTHIPSSLCLIGAAFAPSLEWALALLLVRSALSQMDVPTRSSYVMAVVTEAERPAAASVTAVPRSLASAASPALAGALFAAGFQILPLLLCGGLKIAYDLMLLAAFRRIRPPEEQVLNKPARDSA
jgi:MFS family permease